MPVTETKVLQLVMCAQNSNTIMESVRNTIEQKTMYLFQLAPDVNDIDDNSWFDDKAKAIDKFYTDRKNNVDGIRDTYSKKYKNTSDIIDVLAL